jgi:hypothetical protein
MVSRLQDTYHKNNTSDTSLSPNTHLKCQGFKTPTTSWGFHRSVHYNCPGFLIPNKSGSHNVARKLLKVIMINPITLKIIKTNPDYQLIYNSAICLFDGV